MTTAVMSGLEALEAGEGADLAGQLACGDSRALESLVRLYQSRVTRLAHRLLGWSGDVDDVVQDVFVTAMKKAAAFRGECSLWTWLTVITLNHCRTHHRRRKLWQRAQRILLNRHAVDAARADTQALVDETAREVRAAVAELPARDREVVVLFYLEHRTVAQISDVVGSSVNAVEVRLYRARAKLRVALRAFMQD